jgi:hypothetical protein
VEVVSGDSAIIAVIMDPLKGHISVMTLNVNVVIINILKSFGIVVNANLKTQEFAK